MTKRLIIAAVLLVVVCGGLIGFNLFRAKMIGDFFANRQMPSVAVSATEVRAEVLDAGDRRDRHARRHPGRRRRGRRSPAWCKTIELRRQRNGRGGPAARPDRRRDRARRRHRRPRRLSSVTAPRLERARTLRRNDGVSSEATLESATSALAASESALARIRAVLDQKAIEAPFAGDDRHPAHRRRRVSPARLRRRDPAAARPDAGRLHRPRAAASANIAIGQTATFGLDGEDDSPTTARSPASIRRSIRRPASSRSGDRRQPRRRSCAPASSSASASQLPAVANVIALPQTSVVDQPLWRLRLCRRGGRRPRQARSRGAAPARWRAETAGEAAAPSLVARQVFVKIGRRQGNLIEIAEGLQAGQTGRHRPARTSSPTTCR